MQTGAFRMIILCFVMFGIGYISSEHFTPSEIVTHETLFGEDTTSIYHVLVEDYLQSDSDVEYISYLLMNHVDMPYMNDIEEYTYHKSVSKICNRLNINDPALFYAQGVVESAMNPRARGADGEWGIHQIMEDTAWIIIDKAGWNRENFKPSDFRKIQTNTAMAGVYLAYLLNKHGNIERALSAYNGRKPTPSVYSRKVLLLRNQFMEDIHVQKSNIAGQYHYATSDSLEP